MSKHTPGPWRTAATDDTLVLDAKGNQVASMMGDYSAWESRRMEANARLIAAAPELLAALEKFVAHYPSGINPYLDDAYSAALDAIAEAKKEQ